MPASKVSPGDKKSDDGPGDRTEELSEDSHCSLDSVSSVASTMSKLECKISGKKLDGLLSVPIVNCETDITVGTFLKCTTGKQNEMILKVTEVNIQEEKVIGHWYEEKVGFKGEGKRFCSRENKEWEIGFVDVKAKLHPPVVQRAGHLRVSYQFPTTEALDKVE